MNRALRTETALKTFDELRNQAKPALIAINETRFADAKQLLSQLPWVLTEARATATDLSPSYLDDLFVVNRYLDFLSKYCTLWQQILDEEFFDSWTTLQDGLDLLRLVKRLSRINIDFFETQLTELEKTYPYGVFFSIGITADHFECSICGKDIDSFECAHRRGHLYSGVMATAIARQVTQVDHVALVTDPRDKRCVVQYDDKGEQFKLVRLLSTLISSEKLRISDFGYLEFSKRPRANPDYIKLNRNDRCFCGSGKKFKKCCILKQTIQGDHVDIVAREREILEALT